jgi:hypothetical protein
MPQIYIDDTPLDIDVAAELAAFTWHRATWSADKLIAQSPFRPDSTPSFYCYLRDTATARAGNWGDSGTNERGGIVKLLAHLRGESEVDTVNYLREAYGSAFPESTDRRTFKPAQLRPRPETAPRPLPECTLNGVEPAPVPYLTARGISEDVQRLYNVGATKNGAVAVPLRLPNGKLANVKYRAVYGKSFWYAQGGISLRNLVFAIDLAYRHNWRDVALVEAEIDAMTLMSAGVPALATCGANFNEKKAEVLTMSPVRSVVLIRDNDQAGAKWQAECERELSGKVALWEARVPGGSKDVNEYAGVGGLVNVSAIVDAKRRVGNVFRGLKW